MFPTISVKHDLDKLVGWARFAARDQIPFAASVAINAVAQDAADELQRNLPRELDRPTSFTMKAWAVWRSNKHNLTAQVFAKDAQAKYLRWQVEGGVRIPQRKALRLPSAIKLDAHGNLPKGEIARLVRLAQAGKRVTRKRGERIGVSSKLDLFYGRPDDGRPAGIYQRIVQGDRHVLKPLIVFPQRSARYSPRIPMTATVRDVVRRRLPDRFADAWAMAQRTAR